MGRDAARGGRRPRQRPEPAGTSLRPASARERAGRGTRSAARDGAGRGMTGVTPARGTSCAAGWGRRPDLRSGAICHSATARDADGPGSILRSRAAARGRHSPLPPQHATLFMNHSGRSPFLPPVGRTSSSRSASLRNRPCRCRRDHKRFHAPPTYEGTGGRL